MADQGSDELNRRVSDFVNGDMSDFTLVPKHETKAEVFSYFTPDFGKHQWVTKKLCLTDVLFAGVQVMKPGAENVLHSHTGMDGMYFVLKGRVTFFGEDDAVIGDLGPFDGIVIPRDTRYWFRAVSEEPVELLHIEAFDRRVPNKKIVHKKSAESMPRKTVNVV